MEIRVRERGRNGISDKTDMKTKVANVTLDSCWVDGGSYRIVVAVVRIQVQ